MLMSVEQVIEKINAGKVLALAGDESLLAQLPRGSWIGGTIPYFMSDEGGLSTNDRIFVQEQPEFLTDAQVKRYSVEQLSDIVRDSPDHGYSIVILPGMSRAHAAYAQGAPDYPGLFMKQIVGWIAGLDLSDIGAKQPRAFDGSSREGSAEGAVALHVSLPEHKLATVGILNLFEQGDGDVLTFPSDGFLVTDCMVNGESRNFADYLTEKQIDTRLPLVADYRGEMINVSLQHVDSDKKTVDLYAPVFAGIPYRVARPVANYVDAFSQQLPGDIVNPVFCCNCILNYLYCGLEGKKTGTLTGAMTFGEVAYQLLNQTMVYLQIRDI